MKTIKAYRSVWQTLPLTLAVALLFALTVTPASATTYYWDVNGTTAGFSTVVGAWDGVNAFWNTDPTGGSGGTTANAPTTSDDLIIPPATTSTGSITLSGTQSAGTLTFSNALGAVTLTGGTLALGASPTITVDSAAATVQSIASTMSGADTSFTKEGVGTLALTYTANTFNPGQIAINNGILRIGNNTATTLNGGSYAGNISIANGATLQIWSTSAQTLSGNISGAGGIHKAYGGTLTLSGNNTYTGRSSFLPQSTAGFTVNVSSFDYITSGTWANHGLGSSLGAPTTVANGTIDLGSGSAQATVTLNYTGNGETTDRVLNLSFNGTDTPTISASGSGLLKFTRAATINVSNGTRELILTGTGSGEFTQGFPQLTAAGLSKTGTGTWTLGGSGSFTGPTKITAGILALSSATAIQFSPFDTTSVAGGAAAGLTIATTTLSLGGLTGANAFDSRFTTTSGGYSGLTALTLNNAAGSTSTYSGNIVEGATGMTLTKNGLGTQYLNGANSYTGLTTVSAGTLASSGTFSGPVTVASGAALSPGASAGAVGTLTISDATTSALTINTNSQLYFDLPASGTTCDLVAVAGNLVLNGNSTLFLNVPSGGLAAGNTYTLMTYAAKTGSGSIVFPNGSTTMGNLTLTVGATSVTLAVGAGDFTNDIWKGTVSGVWDGGALNWTRNGTASSAFTDGDYVTFDDTVLAGNKTITNFTAGGTVSPSYVLVNSASNYVIQANIGGTGTLVKSGSGTVTLSGTNTYSGGTVINGGTVTMSALSAINLGGDGANIAFNGTGTLLGSYGGKYSFGSLAINNTATLAGGSGSVNYMTFTGPVTGAGTLKFASSGNGYYTTLNFNSTENTFTGPIMFVGNSNNGNDTINVNSLADGVGAGSIQIGANNRPGPHILNYGSGAIAPLTLNYRQIAMSGTTCGAALNNNATNANTAVTINTDLLVTGAGNKTFTLGGSNTNNNQFAGIIADGTIGGTTSVISLTKANAGRWILSNTNNTYSGRTTIDNNGTLSVSNIAMVGSASSLGQPTSATNGIIVFGTTANSTSILEYLGAGNTTDRQIALAPIGTGDSSTHSATILNNGSGPLIFSASTFYISDTNATGSAGSRNLTLGGTYSGGVNEIQGIISTNGGLVRKVNLTKAADASTWRLSGANNYDGTTTINGGTLLITGDSSGVTNRVTVKTNATLGGNGTIGGSVTVNAGGNLSPGASVGTLSIGGNLDVSALAASTTGKLRYELGPISASDSVAVAGTLTIGSGVLGISDFVFANVGGLQAGTYTLITSGGITGSLDPNDQTNTLGAFTAVLQTNGNNLELVVTASVTLTPPVLGSYGPRSGSSFPLTFSGPSGQTYQVLSSTNVALPLTNWNVLTNGTFGTDPVNYTDTGAINARQFYRIQSP